MEWTIFLFIVGIVLALSLGAVGVIVFAVRWTWWLGEQFKETRHATTDAITPLTNDIAELKADVAVLKSMVIKNGRS